MKEGRSLADVASELDRQMKSKKDFLADSRKLHLSISEGKVVLEGVNGGMPLRPIAHTQLAACTGVPKAYYDKLLTEAPDLLANNVNHWLHALPATKMVRTLDGQVRAILSDSYRPLDNVDLAEAVLPQLTKMSAEVVSCEVTDSRLYIKATTPKVKGVVGKIRPHQAGDTIGMIDDIVQAGVVISNSEVGLGSLRIEAMTYRLVCLNGAIHEAAVRKAHLGRASSGLIEDAQEFLRDETRKAQDRAFFLAAGDTVAGLFNESLFQKRLDKYREAKERVIEGKVEQVVEVVSKRFGFDEGTRSSVLQHLIQGGDLSVFGYAQAVTRASQDVADYDVATAMEAAGAKLIELPQKGWKEIVNGMARGVPA